MKTRDLETKEGREMLQRGRGGNKERLTGVVKKGLRGREEEKSAHAADRSWRTGKENDGDLALWHAEPCGVWLQLESLHGGFPLLEDVLLLAQIYLGGNTAVFILRAEVMLDQVKRLLIDLLVLVALQELDLV